MVAYNLSYNNLGFNCMCHCHIHGPLWTTASCWCQCRSHTVTVSSGTTYIHESKELKDKLAHLENLFRSKIKFLEDNIAKLQQSRDAHSRNNKDIFDRLEELKQANKNINDILEIYHKEFSRRLEKLISFSKDLRKIPYRCPVCLGYGMLQNQNLTINKQLINVDCGSCGGKGIVWG